MRQRHSWVGVLVLAPVLWAGCGDNLDVERLGSVSVDLTQAPPNARCAIITAVAGGMTSTFPIAITPGKTGAFLLRGLATGNNTLSEAVYTAGCVPTPTGPAWTSNSVTVNLVAGVPLDVTFNLRPANGSTQVTVHTNFPEPMWGITEFPLWDTTAVPGAITSGPDGNIWITTTSIFTPSMTTWWTVGKVNPSGVLEQAYQLPTQSDSQGIAAGPDGALWFTETTGSKIGRITTTGVLAEFAIAAAARPWAITQGPDGAMWFTETSLTGTPRIGRISTAGSYSTFNVPANCGRSYGITTGPDGNMWFTCDLNRIGRMSTTGANTTSFAVTGGDTPYGITAGPDGNLWFTNNDTAKVGKITTAGAVTLFSVSGMATLRDIVAGPDGALWFAEQEIRRIGRMATDGTFFEFSLAQGTAGSTTIFPWGMAVGADGNIWFTEGIGLIGRIRP